MIDFELDRNDKERGKIQKTLLIRSVLLLFK